MKKSQKEKASEGNNMNWANMADSELNVSEWLGAIIRYLFRLGRRNFERIYTNEERRKNIILGTIFKIIIVALLAYLAIILLLI